MPEEPQEHPMPSDSTQDVTTEAPSRKRRWLWLLPLVLIGGAAFVYSQNQKAQDAKNKADRGPRAVPITTATVKEGPIDVYISSLGAVTPVATVSVTSRVQGEIQKVAYREGQMVHRGDLLLVIDPRPYQAALTQAEGQLAHDQAVLDEAKIDLERYRQANARNAIASQQLDDQEKVVLQDQGTVKNDEGVVDNAKVNLSYCTITSPIDGRVGLRLVDAGNVVTANSSTPLVVINQLQPITVVLSIAEDYLPQIQAQLGHGKTLKVDAFDRSLQTLIASGSLLTLDNVIDPTTGTVKLKAIFPNENSALFPSQFVNARVLVNTQPDAHLVPVAAIQRNAQGAFVYVIENQTANMRNVTAGTVEGNVTSVTGVNPGEVVATNGFDKLVDGAKVSLGTVRPGGSPAGASGAAGQGQGQHGQKGHGRRQKPDQQQSSQ
jgi:membrane fusion protein, multidrug efflux system